MTAVEEGLAKLHYALMKGRFKMKILSAKGTGADARRSDTGMAGQMVGFGLLLILTGAVGYVGTGFASITALIPAFLGLPVLGLGASAVRKGAGKFATYSAASVAALGFVGTAAGLLQLFTLLSGGEVARPAAVIVQSITAIICAIFLTICIKSVIAAKR